jgi:hypothetical protein
MDQESKPKATDPSLESDAWARFERAVDVVAKSPPQHRVKKVKFPPRGASKRRPKKKAV